jgi:hypothetical protein
MPVFMLSGRLNCAYAWPWPTYTTINMVKSPAKRARIMTTNRQIYGQNNTKIPKIVWRGSLVAAFGIFLILGHLFDVGLLGDPDRISSEAFVSQARGSLFASHIKMTNFQKYAGVLDIDSNVWSSRFAKLLCMDSVVLKVEPTYVDYFWFELEQWQHYVPVKTELMD